MRTILTILHDDSPTGVRTVEFSNRLTKGIAIPRMNFKDISRFDLPELGFSGVYLLIGENENGDQKVYIWQAVNLQKRLEQHSKEKDFWNMSIAFTNKEASLTESEINYLEKELILRISSIGRIGVENKTNGNTCLIPNYKKADMEEFISDMKVLLGNLGFLFLKEYQEKQKSDALLYYLKGKGCEARAVATSEGMLVLKGSRGVAELTPNQIKNKWYAFKARPLLLAKGIISQQEDHITFEKDYLFASPSSAASFLQGNNVNGRILRKTITGISLSDSQ